MMGLRICLWRLGKKWKDGSWLGVCYDTHVIKRMQKFPQMDRSRP
jgi:hypothetical protein